MENCLLKSSLKIEPEILEILRFGRSILAFSHGSDSTALFYTLLDLNLKFDVAFVNYKTRENSDLEMVCARELCKKNNLKFHCLISPLKFNLNGNFENEARKIRWSFFEKLCVQNGYNVVITAHQLNDKFEWFLMQLSKGSGLVNLLSPEMVEKRENFTVLRPLLNTGKDEILNFLRINNLKFFNDISNQNLKFKRNFIRAEFSDKFVSKYAENLAKSFTFLQKDKEILLGEFEFSNNEFFIIKNLPNAMNLIDKACKISGILLSQNQRKEIEKRQNCVVSGKICICKIKTQIFISPYKKQEKMDKKFKELCRVKKIPTLIRGYIYENRLLARFFD